MIEEVAQGSVVKKADGMGMFPTKKDSWEMQCVLAMLSSLMKRSTKIYSFRETILIQFFLGRWELWLESLMPLASARFMGTFLSEAISSSSSKV